MDNVKTFFKTLFWTLLVIIVLLGGLLAYAKFSNKDLGQKISGFIYKSEVVECPVCDTCDVTTCDTTSILPAETGSPVNFEKEFADIQDMLNEILDQVNGTDRSQDEYDVVQPPVSDTSAASSDEVIQDLLKRVGELEKGK